MPAPPATSTAFRTAAALRADLMPQLPCASVSLTPPDTDPSGCGFQQPPVQHPQQQYQVLQLCEKGEIRSEQS